MNKPVVLVVIAGIILLTIPSILYVQTTRFENMEKILSQRVTIEEIQSLISTIEIPVPVIIDHPIDNKLRIYIKEKNPDLIKSSKDYYDGMSPIDHIVDSIINESENCQLDPVLILSIIEVESEFNPRSVSNKGAIGLMQITPIAAEEIKNIYGIISADLFDIDKNIRFGSLYLLHLLEKYEYNYQKALVAYFIGPTKLDSLIKSNRPIPMSYYQEILQTYFDSSQYLKGVGL